jgi:hypothetical protein
MPTEDMENGTTMRVKNKSVSVLPKVAKGQKTALAVVKIAIGMLRATANKPIIVNGLGRTLAQNCHLALEKLLDDHEKAHPSDLVNKTHAASSGVNNDDDATTTEEDDDVQSPPSKKQKQNS